MQRLVLTLILGVVCCHSPFSFAMPHPLKMSVGILTFDEESELYEIELRIFIDDLIVGTGGKLPTESVPWASVAPKKEKVRQHVGDHFSLSLNAMPQVLNFHKMEVEELTVAVTLQFSSELKPSDIVQITSEDSILTKTFVNQRNVLHIDLPGKARRSLLFNAHQQEVEIDF